MKNIIINKISNNKVVAEKRALRLKQTILTSALSFGIVLGSMQSGLCMQHTQHMQGSQLSQSHYQPTNPIAQG